jgi:hypothetical protein
MHEASDSRDQTRPQQVLAPFVGELNVAYQLRRMECARELVIVVLSDRIRAQDSFTRNEESEIAGRT